MRTLEIERTWRFYLCKSTQEQLGEDGHNSPVLIANETLYQLSYTLYPWQPTENITTWRFVGNRKIPDAKTGLRAQVEKAGLHL